LCGSTAITTPCKGTKVSWEELLVVTPEVIREALRMVPWSIQELWRLEIPVQQVAVRELTWLLDLPLWQKDGCGCR
jgi:hypothetical protein